MNKYFLWGVQFLITLFALLVHEKAHAWMARRCRDQQVNIQEEDTFKVVRHIDWIGSVCVPIFMIWRGMPVCAWSKQVPLNPLDLHDHRRDTLFIVASGPAANMMLAAAGIVVFLALKASGLMTSALLGLALYYLTWINFTLAVFNLLPIPPLDGSIVMEVFLRNDALSAFEDIKPYGFIFLLAAIYFHMLDFLVQPITTLVVSIYGL